MKEVLRRNEAALSPLRTKTDIGKIDALERAWAAEKLDLQLEIERLKERLNRAEEQATRDVGLIATLEERLKESSTSGTADVDDVDGEHLNEEMNTSRKTLSVVSGMLLIVVECKLFDLKGSLQLRKQKQSLTSCIKIKSKQPLFSLLINSDDKEIELRERFAKYEMELSAANRKIADRKFFRVLTDVIVTLITSHQEKSTTLVELQTRLEKLSKQVNTLEDDKRKLTQEKDDLQQQLIKQKDRMLEAERDTRYSRGVHY